MKNDCEKYGIAITNYALDEEMNVSRQELFNHLIKCNKCREELFEWQNSLAVLQAEEYHNRPEVKKRMNDMIEQVKSSVPPRPARSEKVPIDIKEEIGSAARKIYDCLKDIGEATIEKLRTETGLYSFPFYEAIGWLAREEKVTLAKDDITAYVSLHPGA